MTKRVYVGPHDAIETSVGDKLVVVPRGGSIEVDEELAGRLDLQPSNWSRPQAKAAREVKEELGEPVEAVPASAVAPKQVPTL